jgi:hypothetical protein
MQLHLCLKMSSGQPSCASAHGQQKMQQLHMLFMSPESGLELVLTHCHVHVHEHLSSDQPSALPHDMWLHTGSFNSLVASLAPGAGFT